MKLPSLSKGEIVWRFSQNGFIASMVTSRIVSGNEDVTDYIELVQQPEGF
ncbi:hypothetical protein [Exiguobacterium sp. s155]|nr:hypothetical protein [Exiguobacterium sp. s155]